MNQMRFLIPFACVLLIACTSSGDMRKFGGSSSDEQGVEVAPTLPSLVVGKTTLEDALLELGAPSAAFEAQRILCWRMRENREGKLLVVSPLVRTDPWTADFSNAEFSLVAVFDEHGLLSKYRVVRLHGVG